MRKLLLVFVAVLTLASSAVSVNAAMVLPASSSVPASTEPDPAAVKAAMAEFRALSRKEKKAKMKEVRKEIKEYKKAKRNGSDGSTDTVLLAILAILLPPLAVYLHQGEINNKFWISLLLTLIFWLPGVIYALIVIFGKG